MFIDLEQIPDFAWRGLERGADDPSHPMRLLTLASVSPEGRPSARLMVNRGADRRTGLVWMHSDCHSPKIAELRSCPYACLVAWDGGRGVQLRLSGSVRLHQRDKVSQSHWDQVERVAEWLHAEQDPIAAAGGSIDLRLPRDPEQLPHRITSREHEQFVVIEVKVETIDWLQASPTKQTRAVMHAADGWRAVMLKD